MKESRQCKHNTETNNGNVSASQRKNYCNHCANRTVWLYVLLHLKYGLKTKWFLISSTPTLHLLQKLPNEIGTFSNQKKDYRSYSTNHPWSLIDDRKIYETDLCVQDLLSETPHILMPKGCRACERTKCSWCKKINQTTTFTSPNNKKTFTIFHAVD